MKRFQSLDLGRGFTVLFIPAIHTVMLYSQPAVYTTWLGYPLSFIAEGPGAQLFMVIMGIVFTFKPQHAFKNVLKKSLVLLTVGYSLNSLKFVLPYIAGLLPQAVLQQLQITQDHTTIVQLIAIGDILHFAAIALLLLYAVYRSRYYPYLAVGLSAVILCIAPLVWDAHSSHPWVNYILQLATGQPPQVFFPLFPWLVYPLLGLVIGCLLSQHPEELVYILLCKMGIGWIIVGYGGHLLSHEPSTGFYRTYPFDTLWHMGIVLLTFCFWQWAATHIRRNRFFELLTYSSEHITQLYIIQWILICWLLPIIGYQQLGVGASFLMGGVTTVITYTLSASINLLREYGKTSR
jgi:hypothetical protein